MIALLGDSVFDNENYVKSKKEAVESVIRKLGYECKLYAVDGAIISSVYSQIEKLKSESETKNKIVLSVGGNNALSSLNLLYNNMHLPMNEIFSVLKEFLLEFEKEIQNLYSHLSKKFEGQPIFITNIYYPCFEFKDRNLFFNSIKEGGHHLKILKVVDVLNGIIKVRAEEFSFKLIDINSAFNKKKYYANEIEPSYQGSKLLAELIINEIWVFLFINNFFIDIFIK